MDARTFIATQVVGHELENKRRRAAEERLAGKARQVAAPSARPRGGQWVRSTALVTRVMAAIIAALLAASLFGQVTAPEPDAASRMHGTQQLVRGPGAQAHRSHRL